MCVFVRLPVLRLSSSGFDEMRLIGSLSPWITAYNGGAPVLQMIDSFLVTNVTSPGLHLDLERNDGRTIVSDGP